MKIVYSSKSSKSSNNCTYLDGFHSTQFKHNEQDRANRLYSATGIHCEICNVTLLFSNVNFQTKVYDLKFNSLLILNVILKGALITSRFCLMLCLISMSILSFVAYFLFKCLFF